jgi:hypothetical protein
MMQFKAKKPLLVKKSGLLIGIINPLHCNVIDLCDLHVSEELSVVYQNEARGQDDIVMSCKQQ